MKTLTIPQLRNLLAEVNHATPISMVTVTDARARKTGNPFGTILKWCKVGAFIGTDYEAAVRRQEQREMPGVPSTFVAEARRWGERVDGCPALLRKLDEKTGVEVYYLIAQVIRVSKPLYLVPKVLPIRGATLQIVPKSVVSPFLPTERVQTNQPVEKEIIWRTYALTSILTMAKEGERYKNQGWIDWFMMNRMNTTNAAVGGNLHIAPLTQ